MGYDGSLKFDTEIDSGGFSSGINKLGGIAKKGMAVTAAAVAGLTTAFGAVTKAGLDSVASLEQNVGGIETLFKGSADTVIKNAQRAYKTAGMSANEYMQNVTSFSASLLQSLGGDTAKAAKIADMAMVDMSDNANKMGTDMERITDAYQGFAKQNYTMLDNLKLGYGGTKTEMERLLADAEKLTGVEYDIDNLSDVYKAIHAIQKNLDITGTTSKEAATTIEGSMNSAKAAYDNFLNGSGSAEELADAVSVAVENVAKNLGEIIPRLAKTIPEAIGILFENLTESSGLSLDAGKELAVNLAKGIVEGIASKAEVGLQIIEQLGNSISSAAPTMIPKALEVVGQLAMGFIQALPTLISTGIQIITAIGQGLINSIPVLIEYVPQIINQFCAAIDMGLLQLIAAGAKLIANLVIGLVQAIPQLVAALPQIILAIYNVFMHINMFGAAKSIVKNLGTGIKSAASNIVGSVQNIVKFIWNQLVHTDWLSLGRLLMQTLGSGIRGMGGSLGSIAKTVALKAFNAIKGINWLEAGRYAIQKVASGVLALVKALISAAKSVGSQAVSAFKGINWASVGNNIIQGIVGGIGAAAGSLYDKAREIAGNALDAIKKKLGIKSPSRVFKEQVGKHIVTGIISGINAERKSLLKTMETLSESTLKKAKNVKSNYSKIGEFFVNSYTKAVESKSKSAITAGKNLINKQIDVAKKKNKSASSAYAKLGKAMISAYTDAINTESKKLISAAEKNIEKLSETYQEKYDEIFQKRDDMISKLRGTGSLYDLDGNIEAIEEYQKRLNALKDKVPDSLMEEILGMDVADANEYMRYLQGMTDKELSSYLKKWNSIYKGASTFSKSFFSSDIEELKKQYQKELKSELNDLKKQMKQMGTDTMQGFISGMKSQTKNMSKTVRSMCNQIIKDIKKQLKIKSPSRVMRDQIGKYLPLGISDGFTKWLPTATKQIGRDIDSALDYMKTKIEAVEFPKPSPTTPVPVSGPQQVVLKDERPIELHAEIHTTANLDGKKVGDGTTTYIDRNMGKSKQQIERKMK